MKKVLAFLFAFVLIGCVSFTYAEETTVYDNFAQYGSVDCKVFSDNKYKCSYDSFEFTAEISPETPYLDVSFSKKDGQYVEASSYDDKDEATGYKLNNDIRLSVDIKMLYDGLNCCYYPRLIFRDRYSLSYNSTPDQIIIKNGENRYRIMVSGATTYRESSSFGTYETFYNAIPFGPKDYEVLKEIAEGKYATSIKIGDHGYMYLKEKDYADLKAFLDICEQAGVFDQDCYAAQENRFFQFTNLNP